MSNLNLFLRILISFMRVKPTPDYTVIAFDSKEGNLGRLAPAIVSILHPEAYFTVHPLQPILHFHKKKQTDLPTG